MRAYDCTDPSHGDMHMTGEDDEELMTKIEAHRDQYHEGMSDDQIRQMVTESAYDE